MSKIKNKSKLERNWFNRANLIYLFRKRLVMMRVLHLLLQFQFLWQVGCILHVLEPYVKKNLNNINMYCEIVAVHDGHAIFRPSSVRRCEQCEN